MSLKLPRRIHLAIFGRAKDESVKLILLAGILAMLSACGKAETKQINPSEYYVNDQWVSCQQIPASDPKCGVALDCGGTVHDCQKQIIAR